MELGCKAPEGLATGDPNRFSAVEQLQASLLVSPLYGRFLPRLRAFSSLQGPFSWNGRQCKVQMIDCLSSRSFTTGLVLSAQ